MKHFLIWRIWRFQIDAIKFERTQIHFFKWCFHCRRRRRRCLRSLICSPLHYLNAGNRLCFRRLWVLKRLGRTYYLPFTPRLACENIRFSSLIVAGDVSRETSPATTSEEKRMFSQATPRLFRASIKPGTRKIPEHDGTFRKLQEHPGT